MRRFSIAALLVVLASCICSMPGGAQDSSVTEELRVRDGLPNFFSKLHVGDTVTVGFVGGSITNQEGWRGMVYNWLGAQYPGVVFLQVNAAVPGTGADFAACRIQTELLPFEPDLVFLEYRVNGGGVSLSRSIEGLIRQIWNADPETDICMVYTIASWMLEDLQAGRQYPSGITMEKAANVYGVPSIDLGVEVVKQMENGDLVFQNSSPIAGKLVFSKDGVHPLEAGHRLYQQIVSRSLLAMDSIGEAGAHVLPEPLQSKHFVNAGLIPVSGATASAGWEAVDAQNDDIYTWDRFRTSAMLGNALRCSQEGESIDLEWEGVFLKFSTIPQDEEIRVEVSIDGGSPQEFSLQQSSENKLFASFFASGEHSPGKHTARLTVTSLPPGTWFYCGQFCYFADPEYDPEGDIDGDGVVNRIDQCPSSGPYAKVDSFGCEVKICQADFVLRDRNSGNIIRDAEVIFNGSLENTGSSGKVHFSVPAGTYRLNVRHPYYSHADSVEVGGDLLEFIRIPKTHDDLRVRVRKDEEALAQAVIQIGTDTVVANDYGIADFTRLKIDSSYSYSISNEQTVLKEASFIMEEARPLYIELSSTAIHGNPKNVSVSIYPNPTNSRLHIRGDVPAVSYVIFDLYGSKVMQGSKPVEVIDVSGLSPGVYFLSLPEFPPLRFARIPHSG